MDTSRYSAESYSSTSAIPYVRVPVLDAMLKRAFDILFSLFVLSLTAPLWVIIAIAIKLDSKGPVIFAQERIGRYGRPFRMYKFRTMVVDAPRLGPNLTRRDDPRITRVGRFLRKWKLDELPQFVNVLKGEMSVIGPRPDYPEFYRLYTPEQKRVFSIRPGMASPAFIAYRDEEEVLAQVSDPLDYYIHHILPDKLRRDLEYVDNFSFWYDMKILLRAFKAVLFE